MNRETSDFPGCPPAGFAGGLPADGSADSRLFPALARAAPAFCCWTAFALPCLPARRTAAGCRFNAGQVWRLYRPGRPGVLADLGYTAQDFAPGAGPFAAALAAAALGLCLLGAALAVSGRRLPPRVRQLTERLEDARAGRPLPLWDDSGDLFGPLADELGKTVIELNHTRQAALDARRPLCAQPGRHRPPAENTAGRPFAGRPGGGRRGAPPDRAAGRTPDAPGGSAAVAGAPGCRRSCRCGPQRPTTFTLLMLAADQVQPLAAEAGVTLDIREAPPMALRADPDWTVEALLNLLKNCVEHAPRRQRRARCLHAQRSVYRDCPAR